MARTNKKYTPEFKIEVIETKLKEKLSSYEAVRKFNLALNVKGHQYPDHKRVLAWERIYLEESKEGFCKEKRGRGSKTSIRKPKLDPEVEENLIAN